MIIYLNIYFEFIKEENDIHELCQLKKYRIEIRYNKRNGL